MLNFLQIRNYAIVESLDLEFPAGFTCITGETGAGKSILVGALGLLCGNRADTSAIRSGARKAELSGEFELAPDSPALQWLSESDLDDGETCLLRRMIGNNGRSRAWINGTAVTLQQLASFGELLIEIHGQNEHMRLVRSDEQFRLLDGGGFCSRELAETGECHAAWSELEREKQSLLGETPLDAGDLELLQYQIRELERDMLSGDDFLKLEAEHRKLARGGELLKSLELSLNALEDEQTGANGKIAEAAGLLEHFSELDDAIAGAAALLHDAAINCDEARNSIQSACSRLDLSPERLEELERQLRRQHDLARKHRAEPDQLQPVLEQLKKRHDRSGSLEIRLNEVEAQLQTALDRYRRAAAELHTRRKQRADELSSAVTALLQELGMKGGQFEFAVHHDSEGTPTSRGSDQLLLQVSANPGTPPGPLRKVASGGELSRISLAIKVASKTGSAAATHVFDEVDAGIGGETAHAVGALLKSLSASSQALCVTHLAQVAVFADHQLQVQKTSEEQETRVETSLLAENDRIDEIARMLGGRLSEQSRAHATELLATAATRH